MDDMGLTEEEMQQLMQMGIYGDQLDDIKNQIAMSQQIKNQPGPQGRDTGRVFMAANPLEHVADVWSKVKADRKIGDYEKQRDDIYGKQTASRDMYRRALFDTPQSHQPPMQDPTTGSMEANVPMPDIMKAIAQMIRKKQQQPGAGPPMFNGGGSYGQNSEY